MLFVKEYSFRGNHAERVLRLTTHLGNDKEIKIFDRNVDVYIIAPLIGFLYGRKAELDKSNAETKIFPEQLSNEQTTLQYNYRLIMLLDKKHEASFEERVNKAFRYYGNEGEQTILDEQLFEQYVRGGVDVLYEKLIENAITTEEYLKNLYDFLDEFDARYNDAVHTDSILELCRIAKK
jgi:hypothetical protein